jgi:hypothetical protein
VVAVVLAIAGFLCYAQTFGHQYTLDDLQVVQHNPVVNEGRLLDAITTPYWPKEVGASNWRPLATFSWALERELAGAPTLRQGIPSGGAVHLHHVLNALLHGLIVLALFPLARRFCGEGKPALLACALFALHPAHTEVVGPVVGRTDLLAGLGALLTLHWWLEYRETGDRNRLIAAAVAFAAGIAGKESAAPVLLLLPLADRWLLGRPWGAWKGRGALAITPLLGVAAVYVIARVTVLAGQTVAHAGAVDLGVWGRVGFAARNTVYSAALLVAPVKFHHILTTLPSDAPFTFPPPGAAMSALWLLLALPVWFGWIALLRRSPAGAFCWVAALLHWAPTSGLVPVAAGMSLRFLFLPTAFAACGAVMGGSVLLRARPAWRTSLLSVAAVWAGIAGALTLWRAPKWENNFVFYEALLREEPRCYTANYGLGSWHATRLGDRETARKYFQAAIAVAGESPRSMNARLNYAKTFEYPPTGGAEWAAGSDVPKAIALYNEALRIDPDSPAAHLAVGRAHDHLKHYPQALTHFRRVLEIGVGLDRKPELLGRCGQLSAGLGRTADARSDYRSAAAARAERAEDYVRRGRTADAQADRRAAISMLLAALQTQPPPAEASAINAELQRLRSLGQR